MMKRLVETVKKAICSFFPFTEEKFLWPINLGAG
jgi:hypothetical protein